MEDLIERLRKAHADWVVMDEGLECGGAALMREAASSLEALREELDAMKAARQRVRDSFGHLDADGNCRCVYCTRDLEGLCEHAADYEMRCHTGGMQIAALREENAVLSGELAVIAADPTRSHAVQQLEAQLQVEREENTRLMALRTKSCSCICHEDGEALHQRAEQAEQRITQLEADHAATERDLAYWKICVNCHEPLQSPGLCASGQDELEQGHRRMLDEWCDERDKLQEQVRSLRAEPSDAFLRACLEGDRDALKKQVADLNEAVSEAIKDRDYYEAQEKQARDRITQFEAALAEAHARGDRWSLRAQETEAAAEERERVAFEAGMETGVRNCARGFPLPATGDHKAEAWAAYQRQRNRSAC